LKNRYCTFIQVHNNTWLEIYSRSRKEDITIPTLLLKAVKEYITRRKEEARLGKDRVRKRKKIEVVYD
jgi:hypothetical protein